MKYVLLVVLLLLIFPETTSQSWQYRSGKNDFDGNYKTAIVVGTGGEFPYKTPSFVVNYFDTGGLNVYFSDAGYAGCDHKVAYFKFDKDDEIYKSRISTNSDKDIWFVETFVNSNKSLKIIDLLEKLKQHNKFSVRLASDCGKKDYSFSLSGSTVAIDFVAKSYIQREKKIILAYKEREQQLKDREEQLNLKIQEEKELIEKEKLRFKQEIEEKEAFEGIVLYPCNLYSKPELESKLNTKLKRGENIQIIDYFNESSFYILKKAKSISVKDDIYFYLNKNDLKVFKNQNEKLQYKKELIDRLNVPLNGIVLNPEYIYTKPDEKSFFVYRTLKKDENVIVIDYSLESDYYQIKESKTIEIPNDLIVYVKKDIIKCTE